MKEKPDALPDFASWRHLIFVADRISNLPDHELASGIHELMNSLDEYFPRSLHPLKDFRSYATRQFCKSISRALHQLENPSPKSSLQI
jgi:hypothetical protein